MMMMMMILTTTMILMTMIPLKKRYTPPPVSSSAVSAPRTFIKEPEITPEAHRENTTFVQIHVEEHHHHLHTATKPPTAPQSQPPGYYNSYIHAPTTIPKSATTAVKPISSKASVIAIPATKPSNDRCEIGLSK